MDERIRVESEPGVGSAFSIEGEFATGKAPAKSTPAMTESLKPDRALVLDNNATAREIRQQMLEGLGIPAVVTSSRVEAIA
jgi:hypothetical protein